jgi:hypothetical protein
MLDVNTAYNMDVDHLINALRCENLGPRATMMLETIENVVETRTDREDELEVELDEAKNELAEFKPLIEAVNKDEVDDAVEFLKVIEGSSILSPEELGQYLDLLAVHDIETPEDLEKILVAVKVLQELKDDD